MSSPKDMFGIPKYSAFERMNDWTSAYQNQFVFAPGFGAPVAERSIFVKRDGDTLKVKGFFVAGVTAASLPYVQLPAGLTIDFDKMFKSSFFSSTATFEIGTFDIIGASLQSPLALSSRSWTVVDSTGATLPKNSVGFAFASQSNGFTIATVASGLLNTGDSGQFTFEVPIKEFSL